AAPIAVAAPQVPRQHPHPSAAFHALDTVTVRGAQQENRSTGGRQSRTPQPSPRRIGSRSLLLNTSIRPPPAATPAPPRSSPTAGESPRIDGPLAPIRWARTALSCR